MKQLGKLTFFEKIRLVFLLGKKVEIHVEEGCNIKGFVTWISFDGTVKTSTNSQTYFKNCKILK